MSGSKPVLHLDDDREYVAEKAKLAGLERDSAILQTAYEGAVEAQARARSRGAEDVDQAAASILETLDDGNGLATALLAIPKPVDHDAEVARLTRERDIATRALDLQRKRVEIARKTAAERILAARRPEYLAILARAAGAFRALGAAYADEIHFRQELRKEGIGGEAEHLLRRTLSTRDAPTSHWNLSDRNSAASQALSAIENHYPELKAV